MKACHMHKHEYKKKEKNKCEEKHSPYQKRKKRSQSRRKEFSHTHALLDQKSTTCVYLWIQSLTQQYMRYKYANTHTQNSIYQLIRVRQKSLVRNYTHLSYPRDHKRNLDFSLKTCKTLRIESESKGSAKCLKAVLTLNREDKGSYNPHRKR